MPNLRSVVAFGEAALVELSGYRESDERAKDFKAAKKKFDSWKKKYDKALLVWQDRLRKHEEKCAIRDAKYLARLKAAQGTKRKVSNPTPLKDPGQPPILGCPQPLEPVPPTFVGFSGIGNFRGSPLWLKGYEGKVRLFPIMHPAACAPKRQPRLRPLILSDIRRAVEFHKGLRIEQEPWIVDIRTPEALQQWFTDLGQLNPRRMSYDIEWSRERNELVAIGLGTGDRVAVLVLLDSTGWQMDLGQRGECFNILQTAFSYQGFSWGGHFVDGYDEHKLQSIGLHVRSGWCSLCAFHILHADLGSAIDEEIEGTQSYRSRSSATGYDLGFIMSVVTNMPYHKYMLDVDAARMDPAELVRYCGLDVAGSWHIQEVLEAEGSKTMPGGLFIREMHEEMELCRRATKMSRRGVPINELLRSERLAEWEREGQLIEQEAITLTGNPTFKLGSGPQLAQALEAMGIKVRWNRETGKPMLDGNEIFKLKQRYPDNKLLEIRSRYQKVQTEIRAYNQLTPGWDGKAHPSWKIHGTVGSRWSSTPNYQNLTYKQREVIG